MECDTIVISNPSMAVHFSMKQLCSHKLLRSASSKIHCILAQNFTASSLACQYDPQHWPIFSKHYSWLRVCTCNAKLSCSAAFSTGYAIRRLSSYKNLEQLFRVHLGSVVQQGQCSVQICYSCKIFPSLRPPFGDEAWALFCAMP